MIFDWRDALACAGRLFYFVVVAAIIAGAITWAGGI